MNNCAEGRLDSPQHKSKGIIVEFALPPFGDSTISPFAFSSETGGKVQKIQEKTSFPTEKKGESTISLSSGLEWLGVPDVFFDLLNKKFITPSDFCIFCQAWKHCQLREKDKSQFKIYFSISRQEMADLSNVSDTKAGDSLGLMVKLGLLKAPKRSIGKSNKYAWNVDNFKSISKYLPTQLATPANSVSNTLPTQLATPANSVAPIYIPRVLELLYNSYKYFYDHNEIVDNSENTESNNEGLVGPYTSLEQFMTALGAAVKATWHLEGEGGTFTLEIILIVLKANFINPINAKNITGILLSLLKDNSVIYDARKQFPNYFKTEKELLTYLDKKGVDQ